MKQIGITFIALMCFLTIYSNDFISVIQSEKDAIKSIETGFTISKVRTAQFKKDKVIIASSFEGTVLAYSFEGKLLWKNELSGFMNHDIWCEDIDADGNDEVLIANADGSLFCLDSKGKIRWNFKPSVAPMYAVCAIKDKSTKYVVCGGYDTNMYYLSSKGTLLKTMPSSDYSVDKGPNEFMHKPIQSNNHITNFIRKVQQSNGEEVLAVQGVNHTMAKTSRGHIYMFKPFEEKPYKIVKLKAGRPMGEMRLGDVDKDGNEELLFGTTTMIHDSEFLNVNPVSGKQSVLSISKLKNIDNFGYRVLQPEIVKQNNENNYFILFGSRILLSPISMEVAKTEVLASKYSFNDMWLDKTANNIVLASCQSGGSGIHILNLNDPNWKKAYQNIAPSGKIAAILKNTETVKQQLNNFKKNDWERDPLPVYFLTENFPTEHSKKVSDDIKGNYKSPIFLNGAGSDKENWDRSSMTNEKYKTRRDARMKYIKTQDQIVSAIASKFKDASGIAYWGGHGNDPYMFQSSTNQKIISAANGKKTVLIFPELEDHSAEFQFVLDDMLYPLAKHAQGKNANIFVRTKHVFWQSSIYLPMWSRLMSGEFSDVFVPAMEETTDKSMELSIASRLGVWASGATDSWGGRCARDNPSLDRLRQHSHQMLPNHFLRAMVYSISYGAQHLDNFTVDQDYMSVLWELIAKGALYVPKRSEIISFSPVHLGMLAPDEAYLEDGNNVKNTTFFNAEFEKNTPRVFSRLNGSWPGAQITDWDFSNYAAGVKDRRLHFIPPYENGMVLMTPVQNGTFAAKNVVRKPLGENLHPLYKNILKEYITDGKDYFSADGKNKFTADQYFKVVEEDIKKNAALIPITVTGNVGWVVAQTSPTHVRLTLVDSGYLNPENREAVIKFNTVKPIKVTDVLSKESFGSSINQSILKIKVPLGSFRFIDIELSKPL